MLLDQESLLISLLLGQVKVLFGGGQIHPGGAQLLFSRRQLLAGLLKDSLGVCKKLIHLGNNYDINNSRYCTCTVA